MPIHIDGLYTREIPTVKYNEKTKEFEVEEPEEDVGASGCTFSSTWWWLL